LPLVVALTCAGPGVAPDESAAQTRSDAASAAGVNERAPARARAIKISLRIGFIPCGEMAKEQPAYSTGGSG
jgi:hypothetical protein